MNCPNCKSSNFFYDKYQQTDRNAGVVFTYAMCKNCGYWKREDEEKPRQCTIFHHNCKGDKQPLPPTGHPRKGYCWVGADRDECACEYCNEIITKKAKWPAEDPNHLLLKP